MHNSPFGHGHSHGDCYATWYAEKKATELIDHYNFNHSDREEIQQTLLLELIERWPTFHSEQSSPNVFISWVIKKGVADIIRRRNRERKFEPRVFLRVEQLLADHNFVESALQTDDVTQTLNLQMDVESILQKLPTDLREIAELLQSHTVTEITQQTGKSRQAVRYALKQIRQVFEEAGFEYAGAY